MSKLRLSRRSVLLGTGGVAIGLPWLEAMISSGRRASAAPAPAQRFLAVYTPGGTVADRRRPTGTETSFTLGPILQPLAPVQSRIIVADGLDMKSAIGEQLAAGMVAWLTGTPQVGSTVSGGAQGPSIDQVIAAQTPQAGKRFPSLQMAVRWGTGRTHGRVLPLDIVNYGLQSPYAPIPPRLDPVATWQELFGGAPAGGSAQARWDTSILDLVNRRYARLAARLGAADRQRLDAHLTRLRDLEVRVGQVAACAAPPLIDTSDYNPRSGLNSADDGSIVDAATDAAIPKVGKLMMDMMVMAMACDMTAVGTLQWADSEAKYTLPWLGLSQTHYFYENGGGFRPAELEIIYTWYSSQHAYLLQQMAGVDMGGHSLLNESVVFFGTEVENPANHLKANMPFLLAGGGGGLRTGRWLKYAGRPHNDLLVSILNLFGDTRATFGDARYCTGPLPNLT